MINMTNRQLSMFCLVNSSVLTVGEVKAKFCMEVNGRGGFSLTFSTSDKWASPVWVYSHSAESDFYRIIPKKFRKSKCNKIIIARVKDVFLRFYD